MDHNPNTPINYDLNSRTIETSHVIIALLVAIAVFLVVNWQSQPIYIHSVGETAARLANSVMIASARLVGGGDDKYIAPETASLLAKTPECKNITHCSGGACESYTEMSDADKEQYGEAVRQYINRNPTAVLLAWAPWCPHCHEAMPIFVSAAAHAGTPLAMFNAELVPRTLLSGQNGLLPRVTHFPFICKPRTGDVYQGRVDVQGIVDFAKGDVSASVEEVHDLNAVFS